MKSRKAVKEHWENLDTKVKKFKVNCPLAKKKKG